MENLCFKGSEYLGKGWGFNTKGLQERRIFKAVNSNVNLYMNSDREKEKKALLIGLELNWLVTNTYMKINQKRKREKKAFLAGLEINWLVNNA